MAVVTGGCQTESGVDGSGNGTVSYRERRRWQW